MSTIAFRKLVQRIREEIESIPDFHMTVAEAARFWVSTSPRACASV